MTLPRRRASARLNLRLAPRFLARIDAFVDGVRAANPGEVVTREDVVRALVADAVPRFEYLLERAVRGDLPPPELAGMLRANDDAGVEVLPEA